MRTSLSKFETRMVKLFLLAVVFLTALPFCVQSVLAQQGDANARQFDSKMIHSPTEMVRDLARLIGKPEENPLDQLDPELLEKLSESGKDFFDKLDDEQKRKAREFAEKFLRGDQIDSPEGRALMDELGISPEMQSRLAKEYGGEEDASPWNRFRKQFDKNKQPPQKGSSNANSQNRSRPNQGALPPPRSSDAKSPIPSERKGNQPGEARSGSKVGDKGSQQSSSRVEDSASKRAAEERIRKWNEERIRNSNSKNPGDLGNSKGDLSKGRRPEGRVERERPGARNGVPGGGTEEEKEKRLKEILQKIEEIEQAMRENGEGPRLVGDAVPENRNDGGKGRAGNRIAENGNGIGGPGDRKVGDGKVGDGKAGSVRDGEGKAGNGIAGDGKAGQPGMAPDLFDIDSDSSMGSGNDRKGAGQKVVRGKSNGSSESAPKSGETDELFKSWLESDTFREIREWNGSRGPSDFASQSKEKALRGFGKRVQREMNKRMGDDKNFGKSEFEKIVFKAAKKVTEEDEGKGLGDSFGGALDGVLDRVADSFKKKSEERRKLDNQARQGTGGVAGHGVGSSDAGFGGASGGSSGSTASPGASLLDGIESLGDVPSFDFKKVLMVLGLALFVGLLIYLLFRGFAPDNVKSAERKFGRSFKKAKISSPKDLVEAVDYFIVSKFGNSSRWWNARHAQEILCAGAPGSIPKINGLFRDYVRARYTRADVELSSDLQQKYKSTLQELSEEVETVNSKKVSTRPGDSANRGAKG